MHHDLVADCQYILRCIEGTLNDKDLPHAPLSVLRELRTKLQELDFAAFQAANDHRPNRHHDDAYG
jgi:hypothetical protein